MILARIVGTVVATRKDPRLVSNKLLLARPVDPRDQSRLEGAYLVAVDTVDAGIGETVLIVSVKRRASRSSRSRCPPMPASWASSITGPRLSVLR
ncbi:MAG: EutN/CcmL family microcompartment protein [Acidobacteria bacterium]|nr:EutN/CcmL family microcompartment protein [Acidobacteriota bacterium]